jgi:hypothetical protein
MSDDQYVVDLEIEHDPVEVLRMMGGAHKAPLRQSLNKLVERLVADTRKGIRPRGVYTIREVGRLGPERLELRGGTTFEGQIASFLEPARRVAAFVVTIGEELEQMAERRMEQGATLEGYILHAIGSAAADAAADAMADHVLWNHANPDEAVTPPFSPGYCGMPLDQQAILFSMVEAQRVGVELLPTMIMRPIKSVSGLIGIGDQQGIAAHGIPCDWCRIDDCKMRRL